MPKEQGANGLESPTNKSGVEVPEGEGKNPKSPEQLLAEFKAENERKGKEIGDLKAKFAEYEEELAERREELENLRRRSPAQERELAGIEDEIAKLRSDPNNKVFFNYFDKELAKTRESARDETVATVEDRIYTGLMNDWLEETASTEGISIKELKEELQPFAARHLDKNQLQRAKQAFKDRNRFRDIEKKEAELKKKEEALQFREDDGNLVRTEELAKKSLKDAKSDDERKAILASKF